MERYALYYRSIFLGLLQIDADGRHRYTPDEAAVEQTAAIASLTGELRHGTNGFADPIPFFQVRLRDMRRWGLSEINYQTDWFCLKRLE